MESVYYQLNPWWEGTPPDSGIRREIYLRPLMESRDRRQVEILLGSRRVGKTTILRQLINELLSSGVAPGDICFLALDHPALSGTPVSSHLKAFRALFDHPRDRRLHLFLDEVQDSPGWEAELKALYDSEPLKLYCTGSTSSLLARQGGKLTGRQVTTTIFPLSFPEFMDFRGPRPRLAEDYRYERLLQEYLVTGGYPEEVLSPNPAYLPNLLEDILARDLIRLFPVKKSAVLKDLVRLVAASVGGRTSFNRLSSLLGLSLDTAKEYVGYLEAAYLTASLGKWTTSHSERVYSQKKLYLWDMGIKTVCTGAGDEGARAENAVYLELRRRGIETGYFAESEREVDFVIGSAAEPLPIEVKLLDALDAKDKRLSGLALFVRRFPATRRALLITRSVQANIPFHGMELQAVPLWRFLLDAGRYLERP